MSLTQGNDPGWTSFSDYKMTTKFNSQPSSVFKMNFIYCPNLVAMSLTSHLYTVELTANVQKPWMNYVNNGLKQIFHYWSCYLL